MTQVRQDSVVAADATLAVSVNVLVQSELVFTTQLSGSLQLGRQRSDEPGPYVRTGDRVVIAALKDSDISRAHIQLDWLPPDQIRVTNVSSVNNVAVKAVAAFTKDQHDDGLTLSPGGQIVVRIPTRIAVVDRVILVGPHDVLQEQSAFESLPFKTIPPGADANVSSHLVEALSQRQSERDAAQMLRGLHATIGLCQQATNSAEYMTMAAQAMIDVVGLETAAALSWDGRRWKTELVLSSEQCSSEGDQEWSPSRSVLDRVKDEARTFWRVPNASQSLVDVNALVAAPILNAKSEVIGALYGDRRRNSDGRLNLEISESEALLVELLSTSAAAGIARLEQEKAAVKARVLFEQFFTPELSRQLESQPDLLLGKDTEVSLLFCDIRRLSEVSEQLGARLTIDWIQDVMESLTRCVADHQGVLVDTLGDRLIGMWGAPVDRSDHAELACRSAIAMVEELPGLNRRWLKALDRPVDLGIGVHTGMARVGNIGSLSKFKYGPLGTSVRVASKVEEATRDLMVPILVTEATSGQLPDDLLTRRLARIEGQGLGSIEVSELAVNPSADWAEAKRRFEAALDAYDRGDFPTATSLLAKLLSNRPSDRAALRLIARIERELG